MALLLSCCFITIFTHISNARVIQTPEMIEMSSELKMVYGEPLKLTPYPFKRNPDGSVAASYNKTTLDNVTDAVNLTCTNTQLQTGCPAWFNTQLGSMPDFMVAQGGFNEANWSKAVGTEPKFKIDPSQRVLVTRVNEKTSGGQGTIFNDFVQFSSIGINCDTANTIVNLQYCRSHNLAVRICVTIDKQVNTSDIGDNKDIPNPLCTKYVNQIDTGINTHEISGCFNSNVNLSDPGVGIIDRSGLNAKPFRIVIAVISGVKSSQVVPENIVVLKSISVTSPNCPPPTTTTYTTTTTSTTTTTPTTTSSTTSTSTVTTTTSTTPTTTTTYTTSTSTVIPTTTSSTSSTTTTTPTSSTTTSSTVPTPVTIASHTTSTTTTTLPPTTVVIPTLPPATPSPTTYPPTVATVPTTAVPTTIATTTLPPTTVLPTTPSTTTVAPTIPTVPTTPVPTAPPTTPIPPTLPTAPPTTTTSTSTTTTGKPYDFCRYDCDFTREDCACTQLWLSAAANGNENSCQGYGCQGDNKNIWKWDTITGNPNTGIIAGKDGIEGLMNEATLDGFLYSDTKTVCTLQLPPLTLPPGVTFSCWGYLAAVWEVGYMADNDVVRKSSTKYDHSNWRHWKKCEEKFSLPAKSDAPVPPYTLNPDPSVHQISFTADNRQGVHPYPNLGVLGLDSFHFVDQEGKRVCRNGKYIPDADAHCTRCPSSRVNSCEFLPTTVF